MKSKPSGKPLASLLFMGAAVIIFAVILFLAAAQNSGLVTRFALDVGDREPVPVPGDPPNPPLPDCPSKFTDEGCPAFGQVTDAVYAWALSAAGFKCVDQLHACYRSQGDELLANERECETVPGCSLKYTTYRNECEKGGPYSCTDNYQFENPVPISFTCTITGGYDLSNYRCDRLPN